ncbi:MAG: hypothetical protein ACRECY_04410, partial [Phyllobacterium sp.]
MSARSSQKHRLKTMQQRFFGVTQSVCFAYKAALASHLKCVPARTVKPCGFLCSRYDKEPNMPNRTDIKS